MQLLPSKSSLQSLHSPLQAFLHLQLSLPFDFVWTFLTLLSKHLQYTEILHYSISCLCTVQPDRSGDFNQRQETGMLFSAILSASTLTHKQTNTDTNKHTNKQVNKKTKNVPFIAILSSQWKAILIQGRHCKWDSLSFCCQVISLSWI